MIKAISELTETLFENIPYTKKCEEAKEKVYLALEAEYQRLVDNGKTQIQALGEIMCQYGKLEAAAEFSGVDSEDILAPTTKRNKIDIWKIKTFSAIGAIGIARAAMYVAQAILLRTPGYLVSIAIDLLVVWGVSIPYKKCRRHMSYDNIELSTSEKCRFDIYRDRYKKRLVNSLFVFVGFTVNFFGIFERFIVANMNQDELVVTVCANAHIAAVGLFILLYNGFITSFILNGVNETERDNYKTYIKKSAVVCGGFLMTLLVTAAALRQVMKNPFPVLYLVTALFILIGLTVNHKRRRKLVVKNIRINRTRIAVVSLVVLTLVTVHTMQKATYILQPYVMSVSEVEHVQREITYEEESGVYTISAGEEDFKILHLTDIHIGGSINSSYKDYKALSACYKLIAHTQPDFVIVTGDLVFPMGVMSFSLNNEAPVMQFASFMRNVGIPWAFTYGNHDTEKVATGSTEEIEKLYQALSYKSSGTLLYPYTQPQITGRSNQLIRLENPDGSVRQALFLIDSNDYTDGGINDYDYIHDDQVDWYEDQVKRLAGEAGETVPSMVFFHIPLQEYRTAYELYKQGSDEVRYYFGTVGEKMIDEICCSDYPSRLFDKAVELKSTGAMFCGHDHYNNISLEYKGIRLTYGMSIDYLAMPGIDKDTQQRGAELITIHPDSQFDIEQIRLTDME